MSFDEFSLEEMPKHIAIIMDGNGRWAQQQGKNRLRGTRLVQKQYEKPLKQLLSLALSISHFMPFQLKTGSDQRLKLPPL